MILPGERIDKTGFGSLRLIQKPEDFCYGIDAVILADFLSRSAKEPESIVDLGTATGIIPIILSHKTKARQILGIELQKEYAERAQRSIELNELEERVKIINADIKDCINGSYSSQMSAGSFDAVITNPPYTPAGGGMQSGNRAKMTARHETTAGLEDFIHCAQILLRNKGDFYMIHRPTRLVDIFAFARKHRLEPKEMRLVFPDREARPNMVLLHCVKNGNPQLDILDPLCVYDMVGNYSEEINEIYERRLYCPTDQD